MAASVMTPSCDLLEIKIPHARMHCGGAKDFTLFLEAEETGILISPDTSDPKLIDLGNFLKKYALEKAQGSVWEGRIKIEITYASPSAAPTFLAGRAIVTRCYEGKWISVTVRGKGTSPVLTTNRFENQSADVDIATLRYERKYAPDAYDQEGEFLFGIDEVVAPLEKAIFPKPITRSYTGVIVIAGGTGAAKSSLVRGLLYKLLDQWRTACALEYTAKNGKKSGTGWCVRHPHLLTIENPIENYLFEAKSGSSSIPLSPLEIQERFSIDYTPRKIPTDTPSLRQALCRDALRQTPYIVYVGETRGEKEWQAVMEFAATGHLVITTTHAESVRGTLLKIMAACGAKTPDGQGRLASHIRAIIHLQNIDIEDSKGNYSALTPSLWLGNSNGIAALISDGPSSILPANPKSDALEICDTAQAFSAGRLWFVNKIMDSPAVTARLLEPLKTKIQKGAIEKDLKET